MNTEHTAERLARFDAFLAQDPHNPALLQQAVDVALAAGAPDKARRWLDAALAQDPASGALRNLHALVLLHAGDAAAAAAAWQTLAAEDAKAAQDPGLRHNLAYALMLTGRTTEAEAWLDDATVRALPQAAVLRVRLLHTLERHEDAMAFGRERLAQDPAQPQLAAHLSVLAIDLEDFDAAARLAAMAPQLPESQTTLGHVALVHQDAAGAERHFEQALAARQGSARAWLGAGLAALAQRQYAAARQRLQHATELAPSHLGGWIARAWAHLGEQDLAGARAVLEQAEALDRSFAETQGSLAVVSALQGDSADARHRMQAALKLDPESLSARLAQALLLEGSGRPEAARAIVERAMAQPMLGGVTLGGAVKGFGQRRAPRTPGSSDQASS